MSFILLSEISKKNEILKIEQILDVLIEAIDKGSIFDTTNKGFKTNYKKSDNKNNFIKENFIGKNYDMYFYFKKENDYSFPNLLSLLVFENKLNKKNELASFIFRSFTPEDKRRKGYASELILNFVGINKISYYGEENNNKVKTQEQELVINHLKKLKKEEDKYEIKINLEINEIRNLNL